MTQDFKKHVFLYDRENKLVNYVELSENKDVLNCYSLHGRELTKVNTYTYKERNKNYTDTHKAQITFSEDCTLFHMFVDGESLVRAIKPGSIRLESPAVETKIYSQNDSINSYSINPDLVQSWIQKL